MTTASRRGSSYLPSTKVRKAAISRGNLELARRWIPPVKCNAHLHGSITSLHVFILRALSSHNAVFSLARSFFFFPPFGFSEQGGGPLLTRMSSGGRQLLQYSTIQYSSKDHFSKEEGRLNGETQDEARGGSFPRRQLLVASEDGDLRTELRRAESEVEEMRARLEQLKVRLKAVCKAV